LVAKLEYPDATRPRAVLIAATVFSPDRHEPVYDAVLRLRSDAKVMKQWQDFFDLEGDLHGWNCSLQWPPLSF
jgi:hypothetical protein